MPTRRGFGLRALLALAALAVSLAGGLPAARADDQVTVFAAASLKNALDDINAAWKAETGKSATISYAASSALAKQIEQGAPADVFISADLDWMDYLSDKNLTKPDTERQLLGNQIVLVAPTDSKAETKIVKGFDLARLLGDGKLAMGNVDSVPAGKYGKAALESSASGLRSKARWRRPRTCAPRCSWSRPARRRSASSTRPTPPPTPRSRSSAPSRRIRIRRSSIRSPQTAAAKADDTAAFLDYLQSAKARQLFEAQGFTVS